MLDSLRAFSRTWYAKIFFTVLVLSFALFGISNVIFDIGTNTLARVGNQEITLGAFQRAYQQQLNGVAQQYGKVPTSEEAMALGIPGAVIGQLANNAALDDLSQSFGVGVSDDRLALMVRNDPNFAGTLGQFDRQNFLRTLQLSGFTGEAEYIGIQSKAARRQQIQAALFADAAVPAAAVELINRYQADQRTLDYFVLNETSLPPVSDPTNQEMADYLKAHQTEYRTAETRTADILTISPEVLAKTITIPDDQIAAEYERTKANLSKAEKRTIRQVVLPDDATVAAFEAGKTAGQTFDALAAAADLPVTDLGTLSQSDITDPNLKTAAFGLSKGDFAIIPGISGSKRAISVSAIEPGGQVSLEDARADIANRLALAQARTQYGDTLDEIEELRAALKPLSEIAQRYNLPLTSVSVTASGPELSAIEAIPAEQRGKVAQAIFAADQGDVGSTVSISGSQSLWFDLKNVEPARDKTVDEVKDALVLAITEERKADAATAEVDKILGELDAGTALADIATKYGQIPQLSQPITRNGDGTPVLTADVAASAFSGGVGHYGAARNEDGDYVIYQVVDIVAAPAPEDAQSAVAAADSVRNTIFSDFVSGLRNAAGVKVNQQALDQVLALDTSGQ